MLLHGVPVSSFLYRKVLPVLADQGLRATAFDFPGLGLAERPEDFDYTWSRLAAWTGEAIDALGLDRVHLVVHDIGGPIGFEWAIRNPGPSALDDRPEHAGRRGQLPPAWPMHPFSIRGVGEVWLRASPRFLFSEIFYWVGIANRAVPRSDIYAHIALLRLRDRGRAFLKIMRGFELTERRSASSTRASALGHIQRASSGGERPRSRARQARELPAGARPRGRDHAPGAPLPAGGPRVRGRPAIADLAAPLG